MSKYKSSKLHLHENVDIGISWLTLYDPSTKLQRANYIH